MNNMMTTELGMTIEAGKNDGKIRITHPALPDNAFPFLTCEGVLSGNKDFGLFSIDLHPSDWKVGPGLLAYMWKYDAGVLVKFQAEVSGESLDLTYTVTNQTDDMMPRVQIHPCIPTAGAPAFRPPRDEGGAPDEKTFFRLYRQLHLWRKNSMFTFASAKTAATVRQLAFMKEGEAPVNWAWWKNDSATFDLPLIALSSLDGRFVLAYGFDSAIWSSSNIGDPRACFHMFPYFGDLGPGASRTVRGRLYFFEGTPDQARARFINDFPDLRSL